MAERDGIAEAQVELSHKKSTEYLIAQHREIVEDLRRDNAMLREENEMLK